MLYYLRRGRSWFMIESFLGIAFSIGMKVLLYVSGLHLFSGKLRSRWTGPFIITYVFPYGAIEIHDLTTRAKQKVNDQQLG